MKLQVLCIIHFALKIVLKILVTFIEISKKNSDAMIKYKTIVQNPLLLMAQFCL